MKIFLLSALLSFYALADTGFQIIKDWIPMKDGVRLGVTLFVPSDWKREKIPALLEYLPYRKDDEMAVRDYELHSYFAKRGFVGAAVDVRGTGISEGTLPDREYSEQEQIDGLEVIHWLATQDWSNGNVGMFGISWGGFNSIQLAMRRPPELKAILAVCASDKLFHDDIHYIDGMMHVDEFSLSMDLETAIAPAPDFLISQQVFEERFDRPPWFMKYLEHERNTKFWRKSSLAFHYDAIQIPVYMIGGLLDGYRDSIPRMLSNMKVPMKALVGPWNHAYPHDTDVGPAIEWRQDAVRWWEHWLKGIDTGMMQEPLVTVFLRDWYPPSIETKEVLGTWVDLKSWAPKAAPRQILYLNPEHGLSEIIPETGVHDLDYVPSAGIEAGLWWGDLTPDQAPADALSLVYDTDPVTKPVLIVGQPKLKLWVSSTARLSDWMVRLSDVAPDSRVSLITGGGLNGAQRDSESKPKDLEPGVIYPLRLDLHFTTWKVPVGHKIRVAISNALWPMIFPTPYEMTTSLLMGPKTLSRIILPLLQSDHDVHPEFPLPDTSESLPGVEQHGEMWPGPTQVTRNATTRETRFGWEGSDYTIFPWGIQSNHEQLYYRVNDLAPESSSVTGYAETVMSLSDRILNWSVYLNFTSDLKNFYYQYVRRLIQNNQTI